MIGVALTVLVAWFIRHQQKLRLRAHLMQEAIRNRDFTFRMPTNGMFFGERAMQDALNQLGYAVKQQINQNEVESWERLTRVLTHEIMNATAPISSITQSLLARDNVKGTELEDGIRAIHTTSQHLNTFVDAYRKLSQWQLPTIEAVRLAPIIADIRQLNASLTWHCSVADDIVVSADRHMLLQILLNLVKNAAEAKAHTVGIEAIASPNHPSAIILCVSNDGQPIPAEAQKSIFVPFADSARMGKWVIPSSGFHSADDR
jgi:signal transduction histidine kinase